MSGSSKMMFISQNVRKRIAAARKSSVIIRSALICALVTLFSTQHQVFADQVVQDNQIVRGSLCVGTDCVNGENFNFDTIRLKENNTRIRFIDTSSTSSFPSNDWQLTANDSGNGGMNKFSIEDISGEKVPFTITAGAPNHSIFVRSNGYIGFNNSAPLVQMHMTDGNSPALRLEQDGSSGFASQVWDVAGNETNFFIRDVSNGGKIPFKIVPGASNNAIFVAADGDVGFETQTPDGQFDIAHFSDANNHAFLVDSNSYVGVNIDNGYNPLGLFDVQTTGGKSAFVVNSTGNVGFGAGSSAVVGRFDVRSLDNTKYYFNVDNEGDIGFGTSTPADRFALKNRADTLSLLSIANDGQTVFSGDYIDSDATTCGGANGTTAVPCGNFSPFTKIEDTNTSSGGRTLLGLIQNGPSWMTFEDTTQNKVWNFANSPGRFNFALFDKNTNEIYSNFSIDNSGNAIARGTISGGSSKLIKDNINPVDNFEILKLVEALEISTWRYKSDNNSVFHIGPMAEDFYTLFQVGLDDKHLAPSDMGGVAISAVKALQERLAEKERKLEEIEMKLNKILTKLSDSEE